MDALQRGLRYHIVDCNDNARDTPEIVGQIFTRVLQEIESGVLPWLLPLQLGVVWLLGVAIACALGRVLDGLSLGETTARSLGLPVASIRMVLIVVLAIATGTAVAQTGLIAFVGLAAPHLVRSVLSTGHRWLIVLASLMGAVLLMAADVLARWLIAPQELPVGVVTAVLGGAYLLWLMHRNTMAQGAA